MNSAKRQLFLTMFILIFLSCDAAITFTIKAEALLKYCSVQVFMQRTMENSSQIIMRGGQAATAQ